MKISIASCPALALVVVCGSTGTTHTHAFTFGSAVTKELTRETRSLIAATAGEGRGVDTSKSDAGADDSDLNIDCGIRETNVSRKHFLSSLVSTTSGVMALMSAQSQSALADSRPESLDIENFLRTGTESFPMGVSSQAGKSKPVTGVYLRDGTEPSRDTRTGDVLSEIVLGPDKSDLSAILVSFTSSWPLAKGTVFDVECRDAKTGDGAFLSVTERTETNDISQIPQSFFLEQLFAPTGRFSFYGAPTNIKVKKSEIVDNGKKRIIQFSFSNLSQSTNAEIPRTAIMVATIPGDLNQAVMLVGSSTTSRWNKGSEQSVRQTIDSFNASLSPKSSMKVRAKQPEYAL